MKKKPELTPAQFSAITDYALRLKALHERFTPHAVQIPPAKAVFNAKCKRVFLRFARQVGKSRLIAYLAVRWALLNPGAAVYILTPTSLQGRAIYLHSGMIENLIPPEYLANNGINKTDARYTFENGSQIRLFGVENAQALRGLTANMILIDEAKDVPRDVVDSVVMPMLLVHDGTLVVSGTPPGTLSGAGAYYWELVALAETHPAWQIFRAKSTDNPYTPPGAVDEARRQHEARGTLDVFLREYECEYAPDSQNSVFPMFSTEKHVRPYGELVRELRKNLDHWRFYVSCDPGSTFAVLLGAINEYTRKVVIYDMVYERGQANTSVGKLWPDVMGRQNQIAPTHFLDDPPVYVVDEAALWFRTELLDRFDVNAWPSRKAQNQKADGLSLMKDLMNAGKFVISDRCKGLQEELQGYQLGPNGLPIKRNDHAIDACRYLLGVANYSQQELAEPPPPSELPPGLKDDPRRGYRLEDEFLVDDDLALAESELSLDLIES
jgi:hypothetical protein